MTAIIKSAGVLVTVLATPTVVIRVERSVRGFEHNVVTATAANKRVETRE